MKLDVLAIAAHPDDVELTCGGTLIKMVARGYKTGILDLTRGEMGTRGTVETRHKEAQAAAKILGVSLRDNVGLPDAGLSVTQEQKLAVAKHIRRLRPHTVILPYWEGRHPDHYTASVLGYEACFLAGLAKLALSPLPLGLGEDSQPYDSSPELRAERPQDSRQDAGATCSRYFDRGLLFPFLRLAGAHRSKYLVNHVRTGESPAGRRVVPL